MSNLLEALVSASERAANVARACCKGTSDEGALLIAEKCGGEANARFERDFKTIADVLAQEAAKIEIAARIPALYEHVRGEECAEIDGQQVTLKQTIDETARLLASLVPAAAAERMAEAAHTASLTVCEELPLDLPEIDIDDLGVWIDPIDATSEFILGAKGEAKEGHGLSCVTVLIGAYLQSTGEPVAGVINQPFYNEGKGRIVWGLCYGETRIWSENFRENQPELQTVLMSSAEKAEIVQKFQDSGWQVKSYPGAGHKLLKIVLDEATTYIVSQGTTFRWDTCAPHAIIRAKGGQVLDYSTRAPLTYNDERNMDTQKYCNVGGIIAYNDASVLDVINEVIQ